MVLDQILQIRLTEEERRAMEEIAEKDERSLSFAIRRAVQHEIERHREEKGKRGEQAIKIREFVRGHYIEPARARGAREVSLRLGDVAKKMNLVGRQAAIAGAIGADKFLSFCNVERIRITGPQAGITTEYVFRLK